MGTGGTNLCGAFKIWAQKQLRKIWATIDCPCSPKGQAPTAAIIIKKKNYDLLAKLIYLYC